MAKLEDMVTGGNDVGCEPQSGDKKVPEGKNSTFDHIISGLECRLHQKRSNGNRCFF